MWKKKRVQVCALRWCDFEWNCSTGVFTKVLMRWCSFCLDHEAVILLLFYLNCTLFEVDLCIEQRCKFYFLSCYFSAGPFTWLFFSSETSSPTVFVKRLDVQLAATQSWCWSFWLKYYGSYPLLFFIVFFNPVLMNKGGWQHQCVLILHAFFKLLFLLWRAILKGLTHQRLMCVFYICVGIVLWISF